VTTATSSTAGAVRGVEVLAPATARSDEILTPPALAFVARLHGEFDARRRELLRRRADRQRELDAGAVPDFLPETESIRRGDWEIEPVPVDLRDRRVEITGPTDRKMVINALNSGARMFMADFEDANSPTWPNLVNGQANLIDAIERTIEFESPDGRTYRLEGETATLLVRPRGWHLAEKHAAVGGVPVSGSLFDFGLYLFHNGRGLLDAGTGPYLYLPKLESHLEARLWNDVFTFTEDELELPRGSIRATVLIETVLAAFEMDEILWELREHAAGLNAGRWDYIFSVIKKFRSRPEFVLPDRNEVTMRAPFMRAYTELLVKTCHRRGAHAMGGMAAFVPSRRDPELNERALAKVAEDKEREAGDGFDGTWVAHPDLVPTALEQFEGVLGDRPNQLERQRDDVEIAAVELLDVAATPGEVTEQGFRNDVNVGIQYLANWLTGTGAAAIFNLMEDVATAEIARSQVWQWLRHGTRLVDGTAVTRDLVHTVVGEELERIREAAGDADFRRSRPDDARAVFESVALGPEFVEFLTLPAYDYLD
jgi:malate synthase